MDVSHLEVPMRALIFSSLFAFSLSLKLAALDHSEGEQRVDIAEVEDQKISLKQALLYTCAPFVPGAVFETLGAIGYTQTCNSGGYEAAQVICNLSVASLTLGSLCLVGSIATPLVIVYLNAR